MIQYHNLLRCILDEGVTKDDRTGTGTRSVFGHQMRFDLSEGFPLVTTKKLHLRSIIHELLWFLAGDTNVRYLRENGVTIWDEWCDENGDLGPVYGKQWRSWSCPDGSVIDQIANVLDQLRTNPDSRRMMVSAWNPADVPNMALPPCHCLFQFYTVQMSLDERVEWLDEQAGKAVIGSNNADFRHRVLDAEGVPRRKLSCQLYQRSADVFLGVPFNIASYALLTHMVAHVTGMAVGEFVHTIGDAHLYLNHIEQAEEQLTREPRPMPTLSLNPEVTDLFAFRYQDIGIYNYNPHPAIKAEVSV